jgi:glycosyltransferase involved in cell wall biosynthesis
VNPDIHVSSTVLICTVYNRGEEILTKTLQAFCDQTVTNFRMLIVDDGSTDGAIEKAIKNTKADELLRLTVLKVDTHADRPHCMKTPRGDNSPVYAFNRGIQWAKENGYENLIFFSSDIIPAPDVIEKTGNYLPRFKDICFHAKVMEPGNQGYAKDGTFCSSTVIRPLGWFFGTHIRNIDRVKLNTTVDEWFDECYLRGFAYEDGDFTGRVAIATGKMVIDDNIFVLHQHHSTDQPSVGHRNNALYARKHWGHPEPWDTGMIKREDLWVSQGVREFRVFR